MPVLMLDNEAYYFRLSSLFNSLFIIGKVKNFGAKKRVSSGDFHVYMFFFFFNKEFAE